jgi:thiol-disulfide isomerase/thioredoxin
MPRLNRVQAGAALALMLCVPASLAAAHHARPAAGDNRVREALRGRSFRALDGTTTSLESLRGQVVVLNLWASWCAPCRKELPQLQALDAETAKKGGRVLAISIDLERRNVERFVRKYGLSLPVYHDGVEGLAKQLDLQGVPYTIVLDRSGDVAFTSHGAEPGEIEKLLTRTRALIAAPPAVARANSGE